MFVEIKHIVRRSKISEAEMKKLAEKCDAEGVDFEPPVEELKFMASFRAQDVVFIDEVMPLDDSDVKCKITVDIKGGVRDYLVDMPFDEALEAVKEALGTPIEIQRRH